MCYIRETGKLEKRKIVDHVEKTMTFYSNGSERTVTIKQAIPELKASERPMYDSKGRVVIIKGDKNGA